MHGRDRAGISRRDVLRLSVAGAAGWALGGCRGTRTSAGAGVPAVQSETLSAWTPPGGLRRPGGIAFVGTRGMVVAESGRHRVHLLAPDGGIAATVGRCGTALGEWNDPAGVAVFEDGRDLVEDGRCVVADRGNGRLIRFEAGLKSPVAIGMRGIDDGDFLGPAAVAIGPRDPDGVAIEREGEPFPRLLVVADGGNRRVTVCRHADGAPRAFLWDGNVAAPQIRRPDDVAMLGTGVVAIADALSGSVRAFQLVLTDVRVAFGEPGATEIPAAGRRNGLTLGGFAGPIRLATVVPPARSDVIPEVDDAGRHLLVAHADGVTVCDTALRPVGRIDAVALGGQAPLVPGGIAWEPRGGVVAVSDAASGTILRARVALG